MGLHKVFVLALAILPFQTSVKMDKNVLGAELQVCGKEPLTGWFRDGCCRTDANDLGTHTVCAVVTKSFLDYTLKCGNDLCTPRPEYGFEGLKPGDKWCLCVSRWLEAQKAGVAPPVILEATHAKTLQIVSMELLREHQKQD